MSVVPVTAPVTNVFSAWARCTREERQRGLTEYPRYRVTVAEIAAEFAVPHELSAAVLAILSPMLVWSQNREAARRVFSFSPVVQGYGHNVKRARCVYDAWIGNLRPLHGPNSLRLFLDSAVTGPKVSAFYRLIRDGGNDRDVCVDGHSFNLAMGRGKVTLKATEGSKREYDTAREAYRVAARVIGVQPCALQAATWLAWRASHGFRQTRIEFPTQEANTDVARQADPYRYA